MILDCELELRGYIIMRSRLKWLIPLILVLILTGGTIVYVNQYYHADANAKAALLSDDVVQISQTDFGVFFDGPSEEYAFIFYPGAKVEETAYAPLLHALAREGMDGFIIKMPAHLAILGMDRAVSVLKQYDYPYWYIGGHSLGGACSTQFAASHSDQLSGVILLAAYPMKSLGENLPAAFIYGSEDGVLNMEKYQQSKNDLAGHAVEYIIKGGNHAQFGSYGFQKGDGIPSITAEEQIEETVRYIMSMVNDGTS